MFQYRLSWLAMYTTVPRPEIIDHRPKSGEPLPQIIDHRGTENVGRRRKEQLPYDTLKKHRDILLEAEYKYKRTIKDLEKEREELVVTYENTYQENRQLKSILEHGPDAAKMKQLAKQKKEQEDLVDRLQDDNKKLEERLQQLEKLVNPAKNDILEKNWKETLDRVRKKREEEDSIPTQGPFAGGKLFKKKRIAIDDTQMEELDTYDLQLDSIQKETQVLLNKVKQLKREKEQIDYTLLMGKGAVTRNAVVANAISEKLNRDLNKYAIRLEKLKIKHKGAKRYVEEAKAILQDKTANRKAITESRPETNGSHTEKGQESPRANSPKPKKRITFKAKQANKFENELNQEEAEQESEGNLPRITSPSTGKPYTKITHVSDKNDNWIPPKQFDKPETYSDIHQKAIQYSENAQINSMLEKGQTLNNKFRDDMRIQRSKNRIKTSSQGNLMSRMRTTKAQAMRDTWVKKKDTANESGGRYANDFEPVSRMKKAKFASHPPKTERSDINAVSAKTQKTYPWSPPIHRNSKHLVGDNETYDDVLAYLRKQSKNSETPVEFNRDFQEHRDYHSSASPIPISFNSDGRFVHGRNAVYLMGNTGIRNKNFYRYI